MKMVGRKGMRWAAVSLALMALTIGLSTSKQTSGFMVNAEAVEIDTKVAGEVLKEERVMDEIDDDLDEDEPTPGATVQVLTADNFERITQVSTGATTGDWFIEFYAPWCGHCRKLEGPWNELAQKLGGKVNVGKVDVTQNKALGKRFGVKGFPTLLMFSHGNVYKFAQARKLDVLLAYAKGGFKDTAALPVPTPRSIKTEMAGIFSSILKDVNGIKDGKMPGVTTLVAFTLALLLVLMIFTVAAPPSAKRPEASRPKVD